MLKTLTSALLIFLLTASSLQASSRLYTCQMTGRQSTTCCCRPIEEKASEECGARSCCKKPEDKSACRISSASGSCCDISIIHRECNGVTLQERNADHSGKAFPQVIPAWQYAALTFSFPLQNVYAPRPIHPGLSPPTFLLLLQIRC